MALALLNVATIWRYFGWFNQTLAMFTLWLVTVYLHKARKCFWISLLPAVFMTGVSCAYIAYDKLFLNLGSECAHWVGGGAMILSFSGFLVFVSRKRIKK